MPTRILIGLAGGPVVAGIAVGVTLYVTRAPDPGPFYEAPAGAEDAAPGALLREERFTTGIPGGARSWRILDSTTSSRRAGWWSRPTTSGSAVPVSTRTWSGTSRAGR